MKKGILKLGFCLFGLNLFAQEPKLMLPFGHTSKVNSVKFSPDGKRFVTASDDHTSKIWDVETGKVLLELEGHVKRVTDASFSPDNKKILTLSDDTTVKLWDSETGKLLFNIKGFEGEIISASFSKNGNLIKITSFIGLYLNNYISNTFWNTETGRILKDKTIKYYERRRENISHYDKLSPDGEIILEATHNALETINNRKMRILDAQTDTLIKELGGEDALFSPDGKKIIVLTSNKSLKICDGHSGTTLVEFKGNSQNKIHSFSNDSKNVLTSKDDSTITIWNVQTGQVLKNFKIKSNCYLALFSKDGKSILTTNEDTTVRIWDVQKGELLVNFKAKQIEKYYYQLNISFTPDGNKIVGLYNNKAQIWDAKTGNLLYNLLADTLEENYPNVNTYLSLDGKKVFYFGSKSIKIWNANTGKLLVNLTAENKRDYLNVSLSPNERYIIILGEKTAKIMDAQTGLLLVNLNRHANNIINANFSADSKRIILSEEKAIHILDLKTGKLFKNIKTKNKFHFNMVGLNTASYSLESKKFVTFSNCHCDTSIIIRDAQNGSIIFKLKEEADSVVSANLSSNGKKIITVSWYNIDKINGSYQFYNGHFFNSIGDIIPSPVSFPIDTPIKPISLDSKTNDTIPLTSQKVDSTSKLQSRYFYTRIKIWDAQNGKQLINIKGDTNMVENAILSPDERNIAIISKSDTIKIIETKSGSTLTFLKADAKIVNAISFSPDSKKIVISSTDNTAGIWDVKSGTLLQKLKGHISKVVNASFSLDGKNIITNSDDNTCKIWDASNGKLLFTFMHISNNNYLITDPFGRFDGSYEARKLVYLTYGKRVINKNKLINQLWVPSLALQILNGNKIKAKNLSDLAIYNLKTKDKKINKHM